MANVIRDEKDAVWPCEEKNNLLADIGKPLNKLTEDEWDILLEHSANCEICKQNDKVADSIINRDMRNAASGLAEEMEKNPFLKGLKRTN